MIQSALRLFCSLTSSGFVKIQRPEKTRLRIIDFFCQIRSNQIDLDDNFFSLGGGLHSMSALWLLLTNLNGQLCVGCSIRPPFIVRPAVVISRKLSKIDPQLLWSTIRKLASLILFLLPHSDPPPDASLWATPLLVKHNRPATPCVRDIDLPSTSAQQAIGLRWRGGPANFLSQWQYWLLEVLYTLYMSCVCLSVCLSVYTTFARRRCLVSMLLRVFFGTQFQIKSVLFCTTV